MLEHLVSSIAVVLVILFLVCLAKCPCGCWRWCGCTGCCCKGQPAVEPFVNKTRVVTLHSVGWCPHCKVMKPVWDRVVAASSGSGIVFKESDEDVTKTPGITGYPTIRMLTEQGTTIQYSGGPNYDNLRRWILAPI